MKKEKFSRKLVLKKSTISSLNHNQMQKVIGAHDGVYTSDILKPPGTSDSTDTETKTATLDTYADCDPLYNVTFYCL
ncbi:class I lanthipeptide [Bacteroidota bacterium]